MAYPYINNTLKEYFLNGGRQIIQIDVAFSNKQTLQLTGADIVSESLVIDRAGVSGNTLELGACIASELTFSLENQDGRFSQLDWVGAELTVRIGNGTASLPMGIYIVDEAPKRRTHMSISALDRMVNFDQYISAATLKSLWDASPTITELVRRVCELCGVTCATAIGSYPNASYTPEILNNEHNLTYRQLLMYCCGIMGKCAYMDWDGNLRIEFPQATTASAEIITEAHRYDSELEDYSITVTGIMFVDSDDTVVVYGTENYAFDLSDNPFASSDTISQLTGLIGLSYTPFSASTLPLPHLYPYDWVTFRRGDDSYRGILTSVTFHLSGACDIASTGESPAAHERANVSRSTATLIRKSQETVDQKVADSLDIAKVNAAQLIRNAGSGHIYHEYVDDADGNPVEVATYILDGNSPETSQHQWKWSLGGFGYSDDYGQTFGTAMTMNGEINADYVTTGVLNANLLRAGIIQGQKGNSFWNLTTGEFHIEGTGDNDKSKVFIYTPTPPYYVGDLWVTQRDDSSGVVGYMVAGYGVVGNTASGEGGKIMTCTYTRTSGDFNEADWSLITNYVSDNDLQILEQRVSNAEFNISANTASIQSKASTEVTDYLGNRIEAAESTITQQADQIELKVSESDVTGDYVIGKINLTSTTAKIAARNIELAGAVTISSLDADAQGKLVTGTTSQNQYYLSTSSDTLTGGTWSNSVTWESGRYIWTRVATTRTYADRSTDIVYSTAVYDSNLTTANLANTTARGALSKSESVYYRSTTNATPTISKTTSIGTDANTSNAWEYVLPCPKNGCYFYTCEKYTDKAGNVTFSAVRHMANTTYTALWCSSKDSAYIDGAHIYAGSVTTDQLEANCVTSAKIAANAITAGKIATGAVTAEKISVTNLAALNATIGGFYITNSTNDGTSAAGGHVYATSLYAHSGDGTYEYEVGIKGDGNSTTAQSGNLAFYVKRITKGKAWSTAENRFYITKSGTLYAQGATISGNITATLGKIGGLVIEGNALHTEGQAVGSQMANSVALSTTPFTRTTGNETHNDLNFAIGAGFGVTKTGDMYASNIKVISANVSTLTAGHNSKVAGWTFQSWGANTTGKSISSGTYNASTTSSYSIYINNSGGIELNHNNTRVIYLSHTTGKITCVNVTETGSDQRLKHDIKYLSPEQSAEFIYSARPCEFRYNNDPDELHHGFIAQDIEKNLVDDWSLIGKLDRVDDDNNVVGHYKTLAYQEFIADIVATLQLQHQEIEALKKEVRHGV